MSLDIYLKVTEPISITRTGIFVRRNGKTEELSYDEAVSLYPDCEINEYIGETDIVFHGNITHNLGKMAKHVGVYNHLWKPDDVGVIYANELIFPLRKGIHQMKINPDKYKEFNPDNGWGTYENLLELMENYLNKCYEYPDSIIQISR